MPRSGFSRCYSSRDYDTCRLSCEVARQRYRQMLTSLVAIRKFLLENLTTSLKSTKLAQKAELTASSSCNGRNSSLSEMNRIRVIVDAGSVLSNNRVDVEHLLPEAAVLLFCVEAIQISVHMLLAGRLGEERGATLETPSPLRSFTYLYFRYRRLEFRWQRTCYCMACAT